MLKRSCKSARRSAACATDDERSKRKRKQDAVGTFQSFLVSVSVSVSMEGNGAFEVVTGKNQSMAASLFLPRDDFQRRRFMERTGGRKKERKEERLACKE